MLIYDPDYYAFIYPQYAKETQFPLLHYLLKGWKEGYNPGPGFNTLYYLLSYPEIASKQINPLVDFERRRQDTEVITFPDVDFNDELPSHITSHIDDICYYLAFKAGLFDPGYYRTEYKDLENVENLLEHYRNIGWQEGRKPNAAYNLENYAHIYMSSNAQDPLLHLMSKSLLVSLYMGDVPLDELEQNAIKEHIFDPDYYKFTYSDARQGNPFYNFLTVGIMEKRNPSTTFNTDWYVEANPDAANNPLGFYLEAVAKGVDVVALPDLLESNEFTDSLLTHCGDIIKWELSRKKLLDIEWYLNNNPDIGKNNALEHFGHYGWRERRDCGPDFNCDAYTRKYLGGNTEINPYCHFIFSQKKENIDERDLVKNLREENDLLFEQLHHTQLELERMRERLKAAGSDRAGNFQDPSIKDKRIAELEKYQKMYNDLNSSVNVIKEELENYKNRYYVLTRFFKDQMRLN